MIINPYIYGNNYIDAGATRAYSVARKLYASYAGSCVKVRESGGNTLADIGFLNGALNQAALLAHCGVNNGFVHTLYDQSGNGKDLVNVTNAQQPQIVTAGAVIMRNSLPSLYFPTNTITLRGAAAADWKFLHDGTEYTIYNVCQIGIVDAPGAVDYALFGTNNGSTSNTGMYVNYNGTNNRIDHLVSKGNGSIPLSPVNNQTTAFEINYLTNNLILVKVIGKPNNGTAANRSEIQVSDGTIYKNNTNTAAINNVNPAFPFQLGGYGNSAAFVGYHSELLIY